MNDETKQDAARNEGPAIVRKDGRWTLSCDLYLADRPGELAETAATVAAHGANIHYFHYNRSEDPNKITVTAHTSRAAEAGVLTDALVEKGWCDIPDSPAETPAAITDPAGLIRIRLRLDDVPGTLARAAGLFRDHGANVLYILYDARETPGLAELSMAAGSPEDLKALLEALTDDNFHYHVHWQGSGGPLDKIIGLNAVEAFLFKLKAILPSAMMDETAGVIRSSGEMRQALMEFRNASGASGESMAASEVYGNILRLAATSITRTGPNFAMRLTGPLAVSPRVSLYMIACPTGGNGYLLKADDGEMVLIDSGFGLYFDDVSAWLTAHGLDPRGITRAYFTHADADHAGWAAHLQEKFNTAIHMHPDCIPVMKHENRAWGSRTRLLELTGAFTRLACRFTDMRMPAHDPEPFPAVQGGPGEADRNNKKPEAGGFPVIGEFKFADIPFVVLEAFGGHVPGQVFFLAPEHGLIFTGDHLIDIPSLSDRDKSTLSIAKFLMTSTNADSKAFVREMDLLKKLMTGIHAGRGPEQPLARVFPGHGDFYAVADAGWDMD